MAAELLTVTSAGQAVETLKAGCVDVGFFAIDPARGVDTAFTGPYVQIEGSYLGREAGAKYLAAFVEEMKASGFVAEALRRHAI